MIKSFLGMGGGGGGGGGKGKGRSRHEVTKVKSRHRRPVTVQKNDLIYEISVYSRFTIKDFSSSRFTECTSNTI